MGQHLVLGVAEEVLELITYIPRIWTRQLAGIKAHAKAVALNLQQACWF